MRRWLLLAFVIACLTPLTWVRSPPPVRDSSQIVRWEQLEIGEISTGEVSLEEAWQLESNNHDFGSYSALVFIDKTTLLAVSDRAKMLQFSLPDGAKAAPATIGHFAKRESYKKQLVDLESLVRDPDTGRLWAGFEGINAIERMEGDFSANIAVRPKHMLEWGSNSGPESMTRLADGRFIVISEGRKKWGDTGHPALLFARDPILDSEPIAFQFEPPEGYSPVDTAVIPDGRVLVLVRAFGLGLPPRFDVKLVIANPSEIAEGEVWSGQEIAELSDPALADNYEGLAVQPNADGTLTLWVISDDNNATFQRTLLLKLRWDPRESLVQNTKEKARRKPARPSKTSE